MMSSNIDVLNRKQRGMSCARITKCMAPYKDYKVLNMASGTCVLVLGMTVQTTLVLAIKQAFARMSSMMTTQDFSRQLKILMLAGEQLTLRTGGFAGLRATFKGLCTRFQASCKLVCGI
ncbi:hypothetical protein Ac2012v2_001324 [Leucoagaricus gongylophorus]